MPTALHLRNMPHNNHLFRAEFLNNLVKQDALSRMNDPTESATAQAMCMGGRLTFRPSIGQGQFVRPGPFEGSQRYC